MSKKKHKKHKDQQHLADLVEELIEMIAELTVVQMKSFEPGTSASGFPGYERVVRVKIITDPFVASNPSISLESRS